MVHYLKLIGLNWTITDADLCWHIPWSWHCCLPGHAQIHSRSLLVQFSRPPCKMKLILQGSVVPALTPPEALVVRLVLNPSIGSVDRGVWFRLRWDWMRIKPWVCSLDRDHHGNAICCKSPCSTSLHPHWWIPVISHSAHLQNAHARKGSITLGLHLWPQFQDEAVEALTFSSGRYCPLSPILDSFTITSTPPANSLLVSGNKTSWCCAVYVVSRCQ